ncbi:MAG: TetR family transcriptional regulator C-terminal domain-containing protein, partial [Cypionkella sp.]
PGNFRREAVGAWLNFWVLAQSVPEAKRLLKIYQGRLRSNLMAELRQIAPARASGIADGLGALIDGLYLREVLKSGPPDGVAAAATALNYLNSKLERES